MAGGDDRWIEIPNWGKFQHYKGRRPVWIKLYLELNNRDDWRQLSYAQRGMLVSLWMAYGDQHGRLPVRNVYRCTGHRDTHGTLESLNDAGWIRIVASPIEKEKRRGDLASKNNQPNPEDVAKVRTLVDELFQSP